MIVDLFEAEEEIDTLKKQLQERDAEIQRLRSTRDEIVAAQPDGGHSVSAKSTATEPTYTLAEGAAVRAAGRRCAVLHMPWMQDDCLFDTDVRNNFEAIINRIELRRSAHRNDESDNEEDNPVDEFWRLPRFEIATPEEIVEEVMSHMSLALAKKWFEPWFRRQFREGIRKIRSEAAADVADYRQIVFQMSDVDFGERRPPRKRGNGAKRLLKDDAYMWAPDDPEDPKDLPERFFRSECLIRATKLILLGPSSIDSVKRSPQSGSPRRDLWHIKSITPSILSFVAVVVHFVLSGDLCFDIATLTTNYANMYEANLRLLKAHKQRRERNFKSLISFYNQILFPDKHQVEKEVDSELVGMSEARRAFYQSMIDGSSDEVSSE